MGSSHPVPLQARLPDTSSYPTTNLQVEMLAVVYLVSALAYTTYLLRMYTRITSKQLGLDYKYNYFGVPEAELKHNNPHFAGPPLFFTRWLNQVLYAPILGLVKTSTLVLMLRIAGHMRDFRRSIYVINAVNLALTISQFVGIIFDRIPVAAYWDSKLPTQHQVDTAAFMTATSTLTVLTDFLVLAVPFGIFVRSQLPRATRCGVILIFMTSGLVTIMGIIRLCVLVDAYYEPRVGGYMDSWGPCLNTLESSLGVMTGCLPTLSPLLREWFPRAFGGLWRGGTEQNGFPSQGASRNGKGRAAAGGGGGGVVALSDFSRRHHNPRSIHIAYSSTSLTDQHPGRAGSAGEASSPALLDPAMVHVWPDPRS
ncbi:hypothetical protein KVR01_002826 [Diaporthe batatas]|uniref:uncharacterized protein n=1 Tax=Diaporthe batatas TaxID=748121 RepID=UPI001D048B13|nr:uncharacterized protein KVR01_002826 [Diaporthe batatas]KAG8167137.1 hypothetical protein KVR01_002826 [Diaporthe batatas]